MKKQLLIVLMLMLAISVYAEKKNSSSAEITSSNDEASTAQGNDNINPKLIDELALTPDQKQNLRESFLQNQKKKIQLQSEKAQLELDLKNVFAVNPVNKSEATKIGEKIGETDKKITKLKIESWSQFLSNLTPAQHQKATEIQAKHRELRRERREEMRQEKQERKLERKEQRAEQKQLRFEKKQH